MYYRVQVKHLLNKDIWHLISNPKKIFFKLNDHEIDFICLF